MGLAGTAFVGGLLEASFLVVLTGVALALVNAQQAVGPVAGHSISFGTALGVAAGLLVVRLGFGLIEVRAAAGLSAAVVSQTRRSLSLAYLDADWATHHAEPSGRLQEILTTFVDRAYWAATASASVVSAALSLLAFLASSLVVDPASTVAVLAAVVVFGVFLGPLRRRVRQRSAETVASNLKFANTVAELGSLGMEMQTYGVRDQFERRIGIATDENTRARFRTLVLQLMTSPAYMFMAYGAVLLGIALLTRIGTADLATFGAVLLLMMRSLGYGQTLQAGLGSLAAQVPFLGMIDDTVSRYHRSAASRGTVVPASALPLQLDGVTFAYADGEPALAELDLRVGDGEVLGVVGPSGAGKSTFVQLVLGLRSPTTGTVRASGVDLCDVDRAWWTRRVAHVAQDAHLITGTVAENIRFFREGIDEDRLRLAAARANILADIERLPQGFQTHLGERGGQLSGGQRQRLSLARALTGDPQLLVLDEPTSALDTRSEELIKQTLDELRGEVTVIIIAHRMSLLDICDRILVIEDGRMTGLATPAALRETSAFYRGALGPRGTVFEVP